MFAMSLGKKDLLEKIKEEEDLVQLLQEHGPLKTKTIEDLRLTLMTGCNCLSLSVLVFCF
jgi:hypothetical protein